MPSSRALVLLAWLQMTQPAGEFWGIEKCRRVRGGRSWSLHAEGRAARLAPGRG